MKKEKKIIKIRRKKDQIVLREYRESIGLTQEELGKIVGVNSRTISAYELGTRRPSTKVALRLAKIFNVKIEDIFPYFK